MATRSTQSAYDIEMLRSERDSARAELDALRKRFAELESAQAIVTPNNCRHCQRAAEQMRDNASVCVAGTWRLRDQFGEYHMINLQPVSDIIMTLPLPACDGCNPLKPDAKQANQADSLQAWADLWHHINNRLGYGDGDLLPSFSNFDALLLPWAIY